MREEDKRARKARDAKAKREAKVAEGMRAWAEAEAREKEEITRIAALNFRLLKYEQEIIKK